MKICKVSYTNSTEIFEVFYIYMYLSLFLLISALQCKMFVSQRCRLIVPVWCDPIQNRCVYHLAKFKRHSATKDFNSTFVHLKIPACHLRNAMIWKKTKENHIAKAYQMQREKKSIGTFGSFCIIYINSHSIYLFALRTHSYLDVKPTYCRAAAIFASSSFYFSSHNRWLI